MAHADAEPNRTKRRCSLLALRLTFTVARFVNPASVAAYTDAPRPLNE
ncbi:hypothetical protein [uncultured Caballeronia sp.]